MKQAVLGQIAMDYRAFTLSVTMGLIGSGSAYSQINLQQIIGGALGAAQSQQVASDWSKTSPALRNCVNISLERNRANINTLIQQGIGPNDPRIGQIRQNCEQFTNKHFRQNFSCNLTAPNGASVATKCDEAFARQLPNGTVQQLTLDQAMRESTINRPVILGQFERPEAVAQRQALQAEQDKQRQAQQAEHDRQLQAQQAEQNRIRQAEAERQAQLKREDDQRRLEIARLEAEKARALADAERQKAEAAKSEADAKVAEQVAALKAQQDAEHKNNASKIAEASPTTRPTNSAQPQNAAYQTYMAYMRDWDNREFVECSVTVIRLAGAAVASDQNVEASLKIGEFYKIIQKAKIELGLLSQAEYDILFRTLNSNIPRGEVIAPGRTTDWFNNCSAQAARALSLMTAAKRS